MKIAIPAAVLAFALPCLAAFAQSGKPDGDRLTNDVWVRLTLKNGAEVEGMATGGVVYERLEKGKFVGTKADAHRDAGLRLHFVDYNEGFLFLRAKDILRIDSEKTLTAAEQSQIRALVKKRQEAVASAAAAVAKDATGKQGAGAVAGAPQSLAETDEQARKRLFAKFPPSDGWGPVRRDEILKKRWTVGVFPDPLEREFLDNFDVWMTEYQSALEETPKGDGGSGQGGPPQPAPIPPPPPASGDGDEKETPPGENASGHGGSSEKKDRSERRRGE